jgi:hypothetical protein
MDPKRFAELLADPREDLDIELKGWLDASQPHDRANVAKAILALANYGGGLVILGMTEGPTGWTVDPASTSNIRPFNQDEVNGIVAGYAEPSFHCAVHLVSHPTTGTTHPIIVVPSDLPTPIRAKRDDPSCKHVRVSRYYTRQPGPRSEEILSGAEWDALIGRCVRRNRDALLREFAALIQGTTAAQPSDEEVLLRFAGATEDRLKHLVAGAQRSEHANPYAHGTWTFSFVLLGDFRAPSVAELLDRLRSIRGETGWSPWHVFTKDELKPYSRDGMIECWLEKTSFGGSHADFWRASPDGRLSLIRAFEEDFIGRIEPGTALDPELAMWRIGECSLHAAKLAEALDLRGRILLAAHWTGLSGRQLAHVIETARFMYPPVGDYRCHQDEVVSVLETTVTAIRGDLVQVVLELTKPLYSAFDFYEMPRAIAVAEIDRMTGRKAPR